MQSVVLVEFLDPSQSKPSSNNLKMSHKYKPINMEMQSYGKHKTGQNVQIHQVSYRERR